MSTQKRDLLRRGNSDLAGLGIFVWSIPALVAKSDKFGRIKTCPNAGICAALCYARTGRYRFSGVVNAHTRNLEEYISDPFVWKQKLQNELKARKFRPTGKAHTLTGKLERNLTGGSIQEEKPSEFTTQVTFSLTDIF